MEENGPQQPQDLMTPQDSLESTTSVSVTPTAGTSLDGSGVVSAPVNSGVPTPTQTTAPSPSLGEVPQKHIAGFLQNKLFRKVGLTSALLLGIIALIVGGTFAYQRTHAPVLSQAEQLAKIKDQAVKLANANSSEASTTLRVGVATLSINGDLAVNGVFRFSNGTNYGQLNTATLTANQTYTLPNASGTICLDSGNCNFASAAQLAALQAATTANALGLSTVNVTNSTSTSPSGVQSINGSVGTISLQGTVNQLTIVNSNGTISFALPQDISSDSAPAFDSLTLTNTGSQNGAQICDDTNNCGFARGDRAILQGGNDYQADIIVGSYSDYGLKLITNNIARVNISNTGNITLGGSTTDRLTVLAEIAGNRPLVFQGLTNDFFRTTLVVTDPTANRNIILPNADGTICLTSGNCSGAGGYGDVLNGGNNVTSPMSVGTTSNFGFTLITSNTDRLNISNSGVITLFGNVTAAANAVLGTNSSNRLTVNSQLLGNIPLIFQGATDNGFATSFVVTDPTANRTIILPNADGTICLTSGNCSGLGGSGDILNGGNNFGGPVSIGTNDGNSVILETTDTPRLTITSTGNATFSGDLAVNGSVILGDTGADRLTINGQIKGGIPFVFQGATDDSFATYFTVLDPTANRTILLPNADGTICLSSGNCSTSGGTGDVLIGGNTVTGTMKVGTNNNHDFVLKTNNQDRLTVSAADGQVTVLANFVVNGDTLLGSTSSNTLVLQGTNLSAPNDLNIDNYTQYIDTINDLVGFGTIPGLGSRVTIMATNGGDGLTVNNGNSSGNILNLQDNGVNVVTVANEGATTFRNKTNSVAAFQIQNALGNALLNADTTTQTISVNGGPSTYIYTNPGPLFANKLDNPVSATRGVKSADFDGDGKLDLVFSSGGSSMFVLMGNGNGTFASAVSYNTAGQSVGITIGNFNNDNKPDIAMALSSGAVAVFMNNGNGTFANKVDYVSAATGIDVASADFDGDGDIDLATIGGSQMSIFTNNGSGVFTLAGTYSAAVNMSSIDKADVDHDGDIDVVTVNTSGTASVFLNNGSGSFGGNVDYITGTYGSSGLVLGDLNGDSNPDIVIVGQNSNRVSVLMNNGGGSFVTQVDYATGSQPLGVTLGDFNGDNVIDIAVGNQSASSMSVLLNNGDGTFAAKSDFPSGGSPNSITAADVSGDGKTDIIVGTGSNGAVFLATGGSTTVKNSLSVSVATLNDTALYIKAAANQVADLIRVENSTGGRAMFSIGGAGAALFRNGVDSTTAFQIQNAAGTSMLNADTSNSKLYINNNPVYALGAWTTSPNNRPNSVSSNTNFAYNGYGYSFRGNGNSELYYVKLNANGTTNAWATNPYNLGCTTPGCGSPVGLHQPTIVTANGYIYVIGGSTTGSQANVVATVYYATLNGDGTTGPWATTSSLPTGRYNSGGVVANGYVYSVAGYEVAGQSATVYYAPLNGNGTLGAWSSTTSLPESRDIESVVASSGYIYSLGGRGASGTDTRVYAAPINGNGTIGAWLATTSLPQAQTWNAAAVVSAGYIHFIGGQDGGGAVANVYTAPITGGGTIGSWTSGASLPAITSSGGAFTNNGFVYALSQDKTYYTALPGAQTGATFTAASSNFNSNLNVQNADTSPFITADIGNDSLSVFGSALYKNATNSTTAFVIQNANGVNLLQADTNNSILYVGNATADATGTLLVLDTKNNTGDPTGVNGAMYYNSFLGKFRCYEAGAWANCSGSGGVGNILQDGNSFGTNVTIGSNDGFGLNLETGSGTTVASFSNTGAAQFKNSTNSTNAFQVQNVAGENLFNVDSANTNITLNGVGTGELQNWATNANALPAGRAQSAVVTANGYVYSVAGASSTMPQSAIYYAKLNADGSVGAWATNSYALGCTTPGCVSPVARLGSTATVVNGFIYVIGGSDGTNAQTTAYVARLNPDGSTGAWTTVTSLPAARQNHASVNANGYIYVIGGEIGGTDQTTVYYAKTNPDGTLGAWTTSANPLANAATNVSATIVNGYAFVVGGGAGSNYQNFVRYAKLNSDGTTAAWATTTALPLPTKSYGVTTMNGYIYIVGGVSGAGAKDITYYAKVSGTGTISSWQTSAALLPATRYYGSSFSSNGYVYHLGGTAGGGGLTTVYYASTSRVSVGGSLDLVGVAGGDGSSGGSLTATNGTFIGRIQVLGNAAITGNTSIGGNFTVFGQTAFQNYTNSASAFQIQNASGVTLFNANTVNNLVSIGNGVSATPTLLQLGNSNNAVDPTGYDGAMYYNVALNKFRCYENGGWKNCITIAGGGGGGGDILNGGNTGLGNMAIGNLDGNRLDLLTAGQTRIRIASGGGVMINSVGTAGTVEKFRVNTPVTVDNAAGSIIASTGAADKALVIQGVASQTGNLQEWQTSNGVARVVVTASGELRIYDTTGLEATRFVSSANGSLSILTTASSGSAVTIAPDGGLNLGTGSTDAIVVGRSSADRTLGIRAITSINATASTVALTVKGVTSQTANLQEWQAVGSTILSGINASGQLFLGQPSASTGSTRFYNSGGAGAITLQANNPGATNYTLNLPAENGTLCSTGSVCTGYAAAATNGYVQIAPAAAQIDTTTNSSIFINKTGASGNIFQLQKTATDVLTVGNTGAVLFKNTVNSTTAFQVQNALGTNVTLDVDTTNNRVGIGTNAPGAQLEVNGNILFTQGAARTLSVAAATTTDAAGAALTVQAGAANGTGTGGALNLIGGAVGSGSNASGAVNISTSAAFGVSGAINLTTSNGGITGGAINLTAGNGGFVAGTINLQTGTNGSSVYGATNINAAGGRVNIGPALNAAKLSIVNDAANASDNVLLVYGATGQTGTLQAWASASNGVVGVVTDAGTATFLSIFQGANQVCDTSGNCPSTLQAVYNSSTNPEIVLGSGANAGLTIRNNATPIAGSLFEIQNNAGTVTYFKADTNGIDIPTGSLKVGGTDRISNSGTLLNVTYNGSTIGTAYGGTGAASFTSNGLLFGNGSGTLQATAAGNSGQCLIATTGSAPTWGSCAPASSGNINQGGNNFGSDVTIGATDAGFGINLLASNNAVARFSGVNGSAIFQNFTNDPNAFQVQNAAGTSLFNIDSTNNRIYIGNATPDSIGTILVLDNKNTAGDPTGVDGAMYYNSNLGKFRCYENAEWKDCIYNSKTATKTADQTFSSTAYANVNSLSFGVVANKSYRLTCSLLVSVPSGTNGGNVSMTGPAAPTQYTATFLKSLDQSGGDNYATSSTYDDGSAATTFKVNTISTGSNRFIVNFNAVLANGASSGTWQLRAKAFDGASSITFYANSSCNMLPL
ncbi:MAG: FG-GAP-like repeat-containing protein [Candidatus Saccharimonadales bacterium]